jgi:hypothetical protein
VTEFVFEPERILEKLAEHRVRFVLIGGLAATIHGSPVVTVDVDIAYERTRENLSRLAAALADMNARLRGIDEDVPFELDAKTLEAGHNFTFATDLGNLDILGWPDGITDYETLSANAIETNFGGKTIRIASLDDLIHMKKASNRPKDQIGVMHLEAVKEMTGES